MAKYKRNMDEEQLAKSIDDVRKTFCNDDCVNCPWSMGEEKCLLITAENHISDKWQMRYRNLMKHYGKVNGFVMQTNSIDIGGYRLVKVEDALWELYKYQIFGEGVDKNKILLGGIVEPHGALDVIKVVEYQMIRDTLEGDE